LFSAEAASMTTNVTSANRTDTIPHVALDAARRRGDHPAIVDPDRRVTFNELADEMMKAAAAFIRAGLKKGDRVALWGQNSIGWVIACLGIQAAGGIIVPLNTRFKGLEVQYVINKSRARFLVTIKKFLGVDYPAMLDGLDLPHLERTITLDTPEQRTGEWDAFVAEAAKDPKFRKQAEASVAALRGEDISDILFTSGTTGDPKGVLTNHAQNVRTFEGWIAATSLNKDDRYLVTWPFFHSAGYKSGMLVALIAGATMYPLAVFDVPNLIEIVKRERITFLPGPPTLFLSLLASPEVKQGAFSSLRVASTGAANVPPSMIEAMRSELGIQRVVVGYGLTETCGTVTMTNSNDSAETIVTTCGQPLEGVEVKCADDAGNPMPTGEAGEVMVRGFNVMQGYLDDPVATAEAITPDGWLHTGDIGILDARGYLRITDRKKDIYITGGFNCYPAEIERILQRNPAVAQVAVVGVPDDRMGEVGKASVVLKPGAHATADEIIAWSRQNMANFKVPRYVDIVTALPQNAMGKVQKFRL
jgi:acyl-CoA synthetase (AMP-forming)/AMP-acid ligase II